MSSFNLGNARFSGPTQVGDGTTMTNTFEGKVLHDIEGLDEQVGQLLKEIYAGVVASTNERPAMRETVQIEMQALSKELVKPEEERDSSKMRRSWDAIVGVAKDLGVVAGVLTAFARLTGLPMP